MLAGTELTSDERAESNGQRISGRTLAKLWVAAGPAGIVFLAAWLKFSPGASGRSAAARPAALPQVVVSKTRIPKDSVRRRRYGHNSISPTWFHDRGNVSPANSDPAAARAEEVYFTAGPNHGSQGLFGYLTAVSAELTEGNDQ